MSRLQKKYRSEVKNNLAQKFGYKNPMLIPELKKIIISMGIAGATKDKNAVQDCIKSLTLLSGQKPILTKAKKSIANFKLREEQTIGLKVTLRKERMYDFLGRFIHIVAPRIRDFRGFTRKADGRGSYSLGLQEQQIFPEINPDEIKIVQGMNVTFVTSAQEDAECIELLEQLGMPFKTDSK